MKIAILGASGFVGGHLSQALRARGDEVVAASIREPASGAAACDGCDAVVDLAGESVSQRWTADVKRKIEASRTTAIAAFLGELAKRPAKPPAFVCASAVGYYGTDPERTFVESDGPGGDFLARVCVGWEAAADGAGALGMRVAKVRTGLALGADGGALAKLLPLFKAGGGGVVASGKQWYSWIHVEDLVGIYLHAIDGASGVLNATAPAPARNADFTHALGHALGRPTLVPVPSFAVGMLLGEAAEIVTKGQRVLPERTLSTGYVFRYPELAPALAQIAAAAS